MRRLIALAGLLLAATACASPAMQAPSLAAPPAAADPPPAPAPVTPPPAPVARAPSPLNDACGAAALQNLVGRPRTEIPVPVDPSRQRVACTTCPVTQDYRPDRLNFLFDAQTGAIKEVRCG